jgi:hypothetical protein
MPRPRNNGVVRPVWERSKSGFPMQDESRRADWLRCLSRAPDASGPGGSSARTLPLAVFKCRSFRMMT